MLRLINQLLEFSKNAKQQTGPFFGRNQMSWASFMRYF